MSFFSFLENTQAVKRKVSHSDTHSLSHTHKSQVAVRKRTEAASRLAWKKKREQRKALQKMLARTENIEWLSVAGAQ